MPKGHKEIPVGSSDCTRTSKRCLRLPRRKFAHKPSIPFFKTPPGRYLTTRTCISDHSLGTRFPSRAAFQAPRICSRSACKKHSWGQAASTCWALPLPSTAPRSQCAEKDGHFQRINSFFYESIPYSQMEARAELVMFGLFPRCNSFWHFECMNLLL